MIANLIRVCIVIAFPLACVIWTGHLAGDGADKLRGVPFDALCLAQDLVRGADAEKNCLASDWLWLFRGTAWVSLIIALSPTVLFFGIAALCGTSRALNAALFPRLIRPAIIMVVLNLLAQGLLLIFAAAAFYLVYLGNPPLVLLSATAIGILGVAGAVIVGASNVGVAATLPARASMVTRLETPELWALTDEIAEALGAHPPDNIVLGYEANFWAATGRVKLTGHGLDGQCKGETLFLSLPFLYVLSVEELAAIIGHELGHFRGRDSHYTARFVPVFVALESARYDLDDNDDILDNKPLISRVLILVSKFPARAQLGLLASAFARNVHKISRIREFEADQAAIEVAEPQALLGALVKLPVYADVWDRMLSDQVQRIDRIRPRAANLARHFGDTARLDVTAPEIEALRAAATKARSPHPYDSHPTTANRAKALGVKLTSITAGTLRLGDDDNAAEALIPAATLRQQDAALMTAEFHAMQQEGLLRDTPGMVTGAKAAPLYHSVYALLAALVAIAPDKAERFRDAADRGEKEMTDFDRLIFSEYCAGRRDMPEPAQAAANIIQLAGPDAGDLAFQMVEDLLYEGEEDVRDWLRGLLVA